MKALLCVAALWALALPLCAQQFGTLNDVAQMRAATKQLNQFFHRFNNEEDANGKPYAPNSPQYREPEMRKKYLQLLFDAQNAGLAERLKNNFMFDVLNKSQPAFISYYDRQWFAEVTARFSYQGREETAQLFLQVEPENKGYKWVLFRVYFKPFADVLYKKSSDGSKFLQPMAHELGFMNLKDVFDDAANLQAYTPKDYHGDQLSLFTYEMKRGNLKFVTVESTKYHFFQIKNWYFEVKEFNRASLNSGWLISNLVAIPDEQKAAMYRYIYREP